jgi:hypothetical protein
MGLFFKNLGKKARTFLEMVISKGIIIWTLGPWPAKQVRHVHAAHESQPAGQAQQNYNGQQGGFQAEPRGEADINSDQASHFPINKQLWTSTYVLFSAGAALVILGLFVLMMEVFRFKTWAYPFLVLGSNAIAVFTASTLLTKILTWIRVGATGKTQTLYSWIYERAFASWAGSMAGSLAFALTTVLLWIFLFLPLYRHKVFIKV